VPPMLMAKGKISMLTASAPPLGVLKGNSYKIVRTDIAPGDTLLAYTDGVTETTNRSGKQLFGEERLKKWFLANQTKPIEVLPSELMQELNDFGRDGHGDDLTLLCVRREK